MDRLDKKSRMSGDVHVRFRERLEGRFLGATRLLLFADSKAWLHEAHAAVEDVCASLRVRLHARKCVVAPVSNGVTFLGYRLFPGYRRLDAGNVKRARRRFRRYDQEVRNGMRPAEQARACVQSWVAHAQHANTYRLCERLLADFPWWQARGKG